MGRESSIHKNYHSTLNFNTNTNFCGVIELIDMEQLKPGQSAHVKIKMIPAKKIRSTLDSGDAFSIVEGNKKIGTGVIENVVEKTFISA
jgi:translation elongation factor EF-Tu-like GTPase